MFVLPVDDIMAWASEILSDLMPLVVVILGISIGLWVFRVLFRGKD